jgi:hypothetical protein
MFIISKETTLFEVNWVIFFTFNVIAKVRYWKTFIRPRIQNCIYILLATKDGGSMFLRNVGIFLQVHTAFLPRRPTSTQFTCSVSRGFTLTEKCKYLEIWKESASTRYFRQEIYTELFVCARTPLRWNTLVVSHLVNQRNENIHLSPVMSCGSRLLVACWIILTAVQIWFLH